jgi:hypothetical protein
VRGIKHWQDYLPFLYNLRSWSQGSLIIASEGDILKREKATRIKQGRPFDTSPSNSLDSMLHVLIYWETTCSLCTMGFQLPSKHSLASCTPTRMQCLTIEKCNWVSYQYREQGDTQPVMHLSPKNKVFCLQIVLRMQSVPALVDIANRNTPL